MVDGEPKDVIVESDDERGYRVHVGDQILSLDVSEASPREYQLRDGDTIVDLLVAGGGGAIEIHGRQGSASVVLLDERELARRALTGEGVSGSGKGVGEAPMPGRVVKCLVAVGDAVVVGQGVMVVEAMKMENELASPIDGEVKAISANEGENVEAGQELVVVEAIVDGQSG